MIAVVLACTVSVASAAGLDCTFPKSSPLEGVNGNSIYFRDGTAPAHVMVTHTDNEGRLQIRTAEVPTSGGVPTVFIGYVSPDGILGVVAVNRVAVQQAGVQGRCTGLEAERAKPITPGYTPSGTIDLMKLGGSIVSRMAFIPASAASWVTLRTWLTDRSYVLQCTVNRKTLT
jgi:hypothetical protein